MLNLMVTSPSLPLCLLLLFAYWFTTISHAQPRYDHCQSKCGKHSIDYPFGIADQPDCYLQGFQVRCINDTVPVLAADASNLTVEEFMMAQGKVVLRRASLMAFECQNQTVAEGNPRVCLDLPAPFTISARSNRFMALGCDTLATVTNNLSFNSSCRTHWVTGGLGHCQSAIPEAAPGFCYNVRTVNDYRNCSPSATRCSFATLVAVPVPVELKNETSLKELTRPEKKWTATLPFVADWEVESAGGNPCGPNTRCNVSVKSTGFLCQCLDGFSGNPYLNDTGSCRSHGESVSQLITTPKSQTLFIVYILDLHKKLQV